MDALTSRLQRCFAAVFPTATIEQVKKAEMDSFPGWDSMASVTLLGVIAEEFGQEIGEEIDMDDVERFRSFENMLAYLRSRVNA